MPGVAGRLLTFLASPRKVSKRRRPQESLHTKVCHPSQAMISRRRKPTRCAQTCLRRCTRLTITCLGNARWRERQKQQPCHFTLVRDSVQPKRLCLVFHCADAVCAGQKMEKEVGVSERSEFRPLPIFCLAQTGTPKGQRRRGRLSLLTFFGEAKKVSGCRATPGKALLHEERTSPTSSHEDKSIP